MKFLCGSCRTKYQISEEKVRGKVLTIRCQKCGSKVRVREPAKALAPGEAYLAEAVEETSSAASSAGGGSTVKHRAVGGSRIPTSDLGVASFDEPDEEAPTRVAVGVAPPPDQNANVEWFSATDGKQQGPFSYDELLRRISAREVGPAHYVWNHGMDAWTRVRDMPALAMLVPSDVTRKTKTPPPPMPAHPRASSAERELGEIVDLAEKRAEIERTKKLDLNSSTRLKQLIDKPAAQTPARTQETTPLPKLRPPKAERTPVADLPLEAIALHTTTPVLGGSALTHQDLAADLFAGLPRMQSDEEMPLRESTRFFIAAAGVQSRKSRNMLGIVLGIASFVALGSFITAWASGFVSLPIPASVNPFSSAREREQQAALDDEFEASDEDEANVRALAGNAARKKRRRHASNAVAGARGVENHAETAGPRGDGELEVIKFDADTGESKLTEDIVPVKLPEARPEDFLPPDQKEISHAALNQVVAARRGSVRICYEESLRSNERLRGKLVFELTVKPSGEVSRVRLLSKEHKSGIGNCISEKMKDWKFPAFEGPESALVEAGFVLEKDF